EVKQSRDASVTAEQEASTRIERLESQLSDAKRASEDSLLEAAQHKEDERATLAQSKAYAEEQMRDLDGRCTGAHDASAKIPSDHEHHGKDAQTPPAAALEEATSRIQALEEQIAQSQPLHDIEKAGNARLRMQLAAAQAANKAVFLDTNGSFDRAQAPMSTARTLAGSCLQDHEGELITSRTSPRDEQCTSSWLESCAACLQVLLLGAYMAFPYAGVGALSALASWAFVRRRKSRRYRAQTAMFFILVVFMILLLKLAHHSSQASESTFVRFIDGGETEGYAGTEEYGGALRFFF
ncbi:hypothetical protein PENSPDRAFT_672480, partial [Peniophora sp. CONT]